MQTIQINLSRILDNIYATSALTTLMTDCKIQILQPDHAAALTHVIRDALAVVIASAPEDSLTIKGISPETYTLCIKDGVDSEMAVEVVSSALSRGALRIISEAAGLPCLPLVSLECLQSQTYSVSVVKPFI